MSNRNESSNLTIFFGLLLLIWVFSAWVTHVVVCLKTASWGFLIAGAIMVPIAVIHGTIIWLWN